MPCIKNFIICYILFLSNIIPIWMFSFFYQGYFCQPTVIVGLKDSARCMQEEIFGIVFLLFYEVGYNSLFNFAGTLFAIIKVSVYWNVILRDFDLDSISV